VARCGRWRHCTIRVPVIRRVQAPKRRFGSNLPARYSSYHNSNSDGNRTHYWTTRSSGWDQYGMASATPNWIRVRHMSLDTLPLRETRRWLSTLIVELRIFVGANWFGIRSSARPNGQSSKAIATWVSTYEIQRNKVWLQTNAYKVFRLSIGWI